MGRLLTTLEVCKMLNATRQTVYKYVSSGDIRRIEFGLRMHRYDEDDIKRFMISHKTGK